MSLKGKAELPERDETSLEDEDLATAQEVIPVPFLCGTQLVAVRFVSDAMSRIAKQAPSSGEKK